MKKLKPIIAWLKTHHGKHAILLCLGVLAVLIISCFFRKATMMLQICEREECLVEDVAIDLVIDTKIHDIIATDAVIEFNEEKLVFLGIKDHETFHKTLSRNLQKNQLEISSFNLPPNAVSGKHIVATLYFKVIGEGETWMHLNYLPKATNESNLIKKWGNYDILKRTKDLHIILNKS